ncbi:MAG TPA: hypothetical protein VFA80_20490 [Xanthobacteraceae bacterium]|nr:hypothetical protein [Xanthobacteraceae bacterium]
MRVATTRVLGLLASAALVGAVIAACRPSGDVGYVEIKTVPSATAMRTALYLDSVKLAPIKNGSAILRQSVGTLKLDAGGSAGAMTPLCSIVVGKNRITSVTISVLERPPRCQCRFVSHDAATAQACVS